MNTTHVKATDVEERWLLYDASEHILGRMAARIAQQILGKDRPTYTPSEFSGTFVVVVNAEKVRVSGRKAEQKEYQHYTGYPGGRRLTSFAEMRAKKPIEIIQLAVRRMLPRSKLGRRMLPHLKVYAGAEHPHQAQKPVKVEVILS